MKQRFSSHTTLIELAAALLCFLLASVIILGLFSKADALSRHSERLCQAAMLAQDCVERIAGSDDAALALEQAGYARSGRVMQRLDDSGLMVEAELDEEQTEVGTLLSAQIRVSFGEEALVILPAARYYNKEVMRP